MKKWILRTLVAVIVFGMLFSVFNENMVLGSASAEELTPETYQVAEETAETAEPAPPIEAVKQGEAVLDDLSGPETGPEEVSAGVELIDQGMPAEESDQVQESSEDIPLPEEDAVYTGEQEDTAEPVPSETVSEETVSESEPGDALVQTMESYVRSYTGETFKVTVSFDESAGIPVDTELYVSEVLKKSDEYDEYLNSTAETVNAYPDDIVYARFFDIELISNGNKIEPESEVSVSIELAEIANASAENIEVVHFSDDIPDVMDAEKAGSKEVRFDAESFSVYGVITVQLPQSADDLDGWSFTMDRDGRYVTAAVNYSSGDPYRLGKTQNASEAAVWKFEKSGNGYGYTFYNISTTVNGQKRYLHFGPVWNNQSAAHATLETPSSASGCPQDFAVDRNNDGTYTVFIVFPDHNWTRYNLNEWNGFWGNGFAGYNQQTSEDHLHLNVQNNQPVTENGKNYAVIVEDEANNKYYAVQADGSLVEVEYDESTGIARVKLGYPLTWAYTSAWDGLSDDTFNYNAGDDHPDWEPFNLRIDYDSRRKNPGTQLSDGDYFRYITPVSDNGIAEESAAQPSHDSAKWANAVRYENHTVHGIVWNGSGFDETGKYIGADFSGMHITGNVSKADAARIHFALIENVPDVLSDNETVSHIDIGILAKAHLEAPLAYGKYYDKDGHMILENTPETEVTLDLTEDVDIGKEDLMNATLKAYDKDGNELDDAFYITGYTANEHTVHSAVQVRMEGSFKVTTLQPYNGWYNRSNDDMDRRAARLDNKVFYEISMKKKVTFPLVYEGKQLYGMDGKPLSVTEPDMDIAAKFDYWADGTGTRDSAAPNNECPVLQTDFEEKYPWLIPDGSGHNGRNNENWKSGAIIDNDFDTQYLPYGMPPYPGDSGMDFILTADAKLKDKILAIEIVKSIVDEDGNPIQPADDVTNTFKLFYSSDADVASVAGYGVDGSKLSDLSRKQEGYEQYGDDIVFSVPGGEDSDGTSIYYDYNVEPGMYYVAEDINDDDLIDANGNECIYKETRVETEYVWRNDGIEGRHIAPESLSGVPEVLGEYEFDGWEEAMEKDDEGNPIKPRNGFLEFYVYNVYITKGSLRIKKDLTVNGQPISQLPDAQKALTDGTYVFTVESTNLKDPVSRTVEITFAKGIISKATVDGKDATVDDGYVILEGLPADTYEVTEETPENGTMPAEDTDVSQSVVVVPGDAEGVSTAEFVNDYETTDVTATKVWNDANDQDGRRPASITVNLLADGDKIDSKAVGASDGWKCEFKGLPKYRGGEEITYTVSEEKVADYSIAYSGLTITNSYTPGKVSVPVTKIWRDSNNAQGIRPSGITVKLYTDGKDSGKSLTLNASNNWSGAFTGLDEYSGGKKIVYTISEVTVSGYTTTVTGNASSGFTIVNTVVPEDEPEPDNPPDNPSRGSSRSRSSSGSSSSGEAKHNYRSARKNMILRKTADGYMLIEDNGVPLAKIPTGEESHTALFILIAAVSAAVLAVAVFAKRRKEQRQ